MAYGVTPEGFTAARLPDILADLKAAVRSALGAGINLDDRSVLGQVLGIIAERIALAWEGIEGVYNAAYPATAEGVNLDRTVALTGIARKPALKSSATAYAYGTIGTVIPVRSRVSVAGNPAAVFSTDAAATIAAAIAEVQSLTFSHVPTGGAFVLTFGAEATSSLAFNAAASAIQTALRALPSLTDVTVSGSFAAGFTVTFAGADAGVNHPAIGIASNTLSWAGGGVAMVTNTSVQGSPPRAVLSLSAEEAGAVQAPAGSLTVIETPVTGWTSVSNEADATVGNEIETDAELRLRQALTVQRSGAGTLEAIRADLLTLPDVETVLIFENTTLAVDAFGRPAKSFEVVIHGGADADIAKTIWEDKPAGIEPYGSTTVATLDSMGFEHDIKFSRPTLVPIYLELDLTTTADYPADGDDRVKAQVMAYGESLNLGDDVIVYPWLVARLVNVPGIIDVVVRIGTAADPTTDANVAVGTFQLASFDESRIIVVSS